jgi:hypothetical protein
MIQVFNYQKRKYFSAHDSLKYLSILSRVRWHMPVILALGRQREEDCEHEASLGNTVRPYLDKQTTNKIKYLTKGARSCEVTGSGTLCRLKIRIDFQEGTLINKIHFLPLSSS